MNKRQKKKDELCCGFCAHLAKRIPRVYEWSGKHYKTAIRRCKKCDHTWLPISYENKLDAQIALDGWSGFNESSMSKPINIGQ